VNTLSKVRIDNIVRAHGAGMRRALEDAGGARSANRPGLPQRRASAGARDKSIGEAFVESDAYRGWIGRFPSGGPSGPGEYPSDPVEIKLSMRNASRQLRVRSLFTT
jgi:hypothetical protein